MTVIAPDEFRGVESQFERFNVTGIIPEGIGSFQVQEWVDTNRERTEILLSLASGRNHPNYINAELLMDMGEIYIQEVESTEYRGIFKIFDKNGDVFYTRNTDINIGDTLSPLDILVNRTAIKSNEGTFIANAHEPIRDMKDSDIKVFYQNQSVHDELTGDLGYNYAESVKLGNDRSVVCIPMTEIISLGEISRGKGPEYITRMP